MTDEEFILLNLESLFVESRNLKMAVCGVKVGNTKLF